MPTPPAESAANSDESPLMDKTAVEALEAADRAAGSPGEEQLDRADLDAVLAGPDPEAPLDNQPLDAEIMRGDAEAEEGTGMADLAASLSSPQDAESPQTTTAPPVDKAAAEVETPQAPASSALPPAGEEDGTLLSQEALDALVEGSQQADGQEAPAARSSEAIVLKEETGAAPIESPDDVGAPPDLEELPRKRRKARRKPSELSLYLRENLLKVGASVAAFAVFSLGTFTYLYTHQRQIPDGKKLEEIQGGDLLRAVESAKAFVRDGNHGEAIRVLDDAIADAPAGPEKVEALFARVEAAFKALPQTPTDEQAERVHARINEFVEMAHTHPRAAEALIWKAQLYERCDILYGARDVYDQIVEDFPNTEKLDEVLFAAARLSMKVDAPKRAASYAQRLLRQYPGSPWANKAKILLADAYVEAGNPEDARVLYVRMAQTGLDTPAGAEAFARLGRLAFDEGKYDEAIKQLKTCLDMATTVEGNDKVSLLLARAYRAAGQLGEARRVLNELIEFFPENETTPEAFIELSEVLDDLGLRADAVRLAVQASQRYPKNQKVLANKASMFERDGNTLGAAQAWLAAHRAGPANPTYLLAAARGFHKSQALDEAMSAYRELVKFFPRAPEAFEGGIELAEVQYDNGQVGKALDSLDNLALVTEGKPQQLPVLIALGKMCMDLGLNDRAAEVFGKVAVFTTEPEMLGQAATAMLEAGAIEEGMAVAERLDTAKLTDTTAYQLGMAYGKALLRVDPRRAIERMERTYEDYPAERTPDGNQQLLEAYLAVGSSARARALVMDLDDHVRRNRIDAPRLAKAAVTWGDYLYDRADARAAADAYALAIQAGPEDLDAVQWAKFQRANALLDLSDFEGSLHLFDEIAASDAPWAKQALAKAEYARTEQRLRGLPVTPREEEG